MPYFLNIKDLEMNDDNMNKQSVLDVLTSDTVTADPIFDESGYQIGIAAPLFDKESEERGRRIGNLNPGNYKYNENVAIDKIIQYVNSTYGQHYVGNGDVQTVDFWESLGSLETTCRDTAIKYLARYGKKGGKNEKDLLKAIHYIILMMYAAEYNPEKHGDDR